jgi:hypothetical protein
MKIEIPKDRNLPVRITKEPTDEGYKKPESGYWVRLPEKWWRGALRGLRPVERCLLISLKVWGHRSPSTNKLAKELGIKWETADKGLKSLRKKGYITSPKSEK